MSDRKFEQFVIGEHIKSHGRTITETDLVNFCCFAGLRLPMFVDEEWSKKNSIFGSRVVPGLMTASIAGGMLESVLGNNLVAALGLDGFKFTAPIRIGDTLHADVSVVSKKEIKDLSKGIVKLRVELLNQHGASPAEFSGSFMIRRVVLASDRS